MTIGIIDTGIDTSNPEFSGRISPASADVAGSRSVEDIDGHGTMVALLAAAARNNSGIMGIAWEATIMALRADTVGSCGSLNGCTFFDTNIALGVDRAVQNGAKVINISLGGDPPSQRLLDAITRAANADVVVVVAAGNEANDPAPVAPDNPNPFAIGLRQAGNGNVIIAGSVDATGRISDFSNRAGSERNWYLLGLGEEVCCLYENGQIKTEMRNGQSFVFVVSGTSFSAPQIAGAAALVRQAFPNLSATDVVDLLLRTARDVGAAGTDAIYGRGILDIAAAFAPQGTLSLAGGSQRLALADVGMVTSSAMGDAAGGAGALQAVMLDSYRRAYRVNIAQNLRSAAVSPRLARSLIAPLRQASGGSENLSLAFSMDASRQAQMLPWSGQLRLAGEDARHAEVLAAQVIARISPETRVAFGFAQGADGLVAQVQGASWPAFLVAGAPADDTGFAGNAGFAFALRRDLGRWGLTLSGESGKVLSAATMRDIAFLSRL
ncbi:MAG: S8 family serine peptidase, partial [Novosphingobium sp.]|nr:S8 family serine peptidase [Novosphingobium sp.]